MCQAGPDYRRGDELPHIAIIGACPGRQEEEAGRPFIGPTGANLAVMVGIINGLRADKFPSGFRDDYTLLNAHSIPRYVGRVGYDGRTEPSRAEVLNEDNIARLIHQLEQTEITRALLTGLRPKWLIERLIDELPGIELFGSGHPSQRRWNLFYPGRPQAEKLTRWAQDSFEVVWPLT